MNRTETKRAVAYIRVSDLSQVEGHSLDAQERLFTELCKARGWTLTERKASPLIATQ